MARIRHSASGAHAVVGPSLGTAGGSVTPSAARSRRQARSSARRPRRTRCGCWPRPAGPRPPGSRRARSATRSSADRSPRRASRQESTPAATVYAAVIAAPTPTPKIAVAPASIQTPADRAMSVQPTAAVAAAPHMAARGRHAGEHVPARGVADCPGQRGDREHDAREDGDLAATDADLLEVQGQDGPEAPVDELEAEDHRHQEHEVPEGQDFAKPGTARRRPGVGPRGGRPLVVEHEDDGQRDADTARRSRKTPAAGPRPPPAPRREWDRLRDPDAGPSARCRSRRPPGRSAPIRPPSSA